MRRRREPAAPIHVLFLTKHMNIGGGEFVIHTLIERLDRQRFRPVLACLEEEGSFGRQLREQGIPTYSRLLMHKADLAVVLRLVRAMRREEIDLLYLLNYPSAILWGGAAAHLAGIPSIVALHSNALWELSGPVHRLGRKLLHWHDRLVTIGAYQKDYLVAREGLAKERIEVIANGIDLARYGAVEANPMCRQLLGLRAPSFVIGTVAVLRPEKNLVMLLEAMRQLLAQGLDAQLVIVGDGSERGRLEQRAEALGLAERVTFLGYRDDAADLLRLFDVFVLTSRSEVMPISVLEAMASGLPVVATAVGAVPEVVCDGETGYVIASGDSQALAEQLGRLAEAPQLRQRMGTRGRERIGLLFSLDRMIARTESLLRATVAGA